MDCKEILQSREIGGVHMGLQDMKIAIDKFIDEYSGTAIGESIFRKRCNIWDDDYDGIEAIYKELEDKGYL